MENENAKKILDVKLKIKSAISSESESQNSFGHTIVLG